MKKVFSLFFLVLILSVSFSQTTLTVAEDFTLTDVDGVEHNLFDYLDDGKYVLIDFFYDTCVPCQETAPKIQEAYEHFGCNSADLIVLGIDNNDTDAEVIAFGETYGANYPAISGIDGGGNAVVSTYGINLFPTVILIAPNHDIVETDIWPISDGTFLINLITPYGPQEASCGELNNETDIISFSLTSQTGNATIGDGTIDIEVEYGTNLTTLSPTFELSNGATASINGTEQVSGVTVVDFSSGTATYRVTAENGTDTEEWIISVTTAPNNIYDNNNTNINIFPVPANNFVNITNAENYKLEIYNITGKIMLQQMIISNKDVIDLQSYPAGLYSIKLSKNNNVKLFNINVVK